MSEAHNAQDEAPPAPLLRRRSGPSLVWLIPLLTALIGGWLIYKTFSEKGPAFTISFSTLGGTLSDSVIVNLWIAPWP